MTVSNADKVRYALGLFLRVRDLEQALDELREVGFPMHQVKLIAPPDDRDVDASRWSVCGSALGLETWVVSEASDGSCPWSFTQSSRRSDGEGAANLATKSDVMPGFHIWVMERHAQQLDRHLRSGGAIAVVQVKTGSEERSAYSALLQHAKSGVQTHEISSHS